MRDCRKLFNEISRELRLRPSNVSFANLRFNQQPILLRQCPPKPKNSPPSKNLHTSSPKIRLQTPLQKLKVTLHFPLIMVIIIRQIKLLAQFQDHEPVLLDRELVFSTSKVVYGAVVLVLLHVGAWDSRVFGREFEAVGFFAGEGGGGVEVVDSCLHFFSSVALVFVPLDVDG